MERSAFVDGHRLIDGTDLNYTMARPYWSYGGPTKATTGGTLATSVKAVETLTTIAEATANAGLTIPQALPGAVRVVINKSANSIIVYAEKGSTINGLAGIVGVEQKAGYGCFYIATDVNVWEQLAFQAIGGGGVLPTFSPYSVIYADASGALTGTPSTFSWNATTGLLQLLGPLGATAGLADRLLLYSNGLGDARGIGAQADGLAYNSGAGAHKFYSGGTSPTLLSTISSTGLSLSGIGSITASGLSLTNIGSISLANGLLLAGNVQLASTGLTLPTIGSISSAGLSLTGIGSFALGSLTLNGATSGQVAIKTQAGAGTWNFNLPVSAGTAGYVLTSQGGGASPMTWAPPPGLPAITPKITVNTTLGNGAQFVLVDTTNGAVTVKLPDPAANTGVTIHFIKIASNTSFNLMRVIDFANVYAGQASKNGNGFSVISDGADWWVQSTCDLYGAL